MLRIRFERDEPSAPSLDLQTASGQWLGPAHFRGRAHLVLFFPHETTDGIALAIVNELARRAPELKSSDAEALIAWPGRDLPDAPDGVFVVADEVGALRARYANLLEFDTDGQTLLFVLNEFGSPSAGWVGADSATELVDEVMRWLRSAALICALCTVPERSLQTWLDA